MTGDQIRAYAAATVGPSRIAQGLPPTLVDPGQLERLAAIVDTPTAQNDKQVAS